MFQGKNKLILRKSMEKYTQETTIRALAILG